MVPTIKCIDRQEVFYLRVTTVIYISIVCKRFINRLCCFEQRKWGAFLFRTVNARSYTRMSGFPSLVNTVTLVCLLSQVRKKVRNARIPRHLLLIVPHLILTNGFDKALAMGVDGLPSTRIVTSLYPGVSLHKELSGTSKWPISKPLFVVRLLTERLSS